jgi:Transcriptional regulator
VPTNTFENLAKDKKDKLLKAAMKEFSQKLFEDASINQIIKNAGISRGSFYTYFEDKEDIYFYIINYYDTNYRTKVINYLKNSNGDLLSAFVLAFREILKKSHNSEYKNLFKNVFLSLKIINHNKKPSDFHKKQDIFKEELMSNINKSLYNLKNNEEYNDLIEILMIITNVSLTHSFIKEQSLEDAVSSYTRKINMLKIGIIREEEKNETNI